MLYSNDEDVIVGINKSEFKNLLLATQESYFIFNAVLYKQNDDVAMGSPPGPTMANVFLSFHEVKWLEQCPKLRNLNQFFTEDMLMTFLFSSNWLNISQNFVIILILVIQTCLFPLIKKKMESSFLDVEVSREKGKFVTTVYRKLGFSSVYTHFESFLPTVYKFGIVYTLASCCLKICSDWTKFHEELSFLKLVFLKKAGTLCHLLINVLKLLFISCS